MIEYSGGTIGLKDVKLSAIQNKDFSETPLLVPDDARRVARRRFKRRQTTTMTIDTSWLGAEWDDKECKPTAKWQLEKFSPYSCNIMHELDMNPITSGTRLIRCGGDRCAYHVRDSQGQEAVLKTLM